VNYLCINSSESECYLSLWNQDKPRTTMSWDAGRTLADEIFVKIDEVLASSSCQYADLRGLVIYSGPGSFTGLRISHTVFNTLAYSLNIPIVGEVGDDWIRQGIMRLSTGKNDKIVSPIYGGKVNISKPKK